jgi:hypothetical protein
MIDYVLEPNLLTKEKPNDRYARVVNVQSMTESDLAEAVAGRNIGISKAEALAMLEATSEIELEWLKAGHSVNLRLMHLHPAIPGNYEEGEYPKEALIRITPSKEVNEAAKKISLRHVEPVNPIRVEYVHDMKSNTTNDKITSGGSVKIRGHNLKIDGTLPSLGVEFFNVDYPETVYPVPSDDLIVNNPSELILTAPLMTTDEKVKLKITTQYSNSTKPLKAPRSVIFERELTVL